MRKSEELLEKLRRIGFSRLTSLEDALEKLFSKIQLNPIEEIKVTDSLNRILAIDIVSEMNIPPFDRSAMDGYAIKAEDSFNASPKNPKKIKFIGIIEIGESSNLKLNKEEGIRISTGAPIPEGADAVVKIEDTEFENEIISIYISLPPGKNVSNRGEDIKKGTHVLSEGTELKAEHIALLSSLGFNKVKVRTKPKTSVFSSGDELLEPGLPLQPGKIYNSNTPMISTLVRIYGGIVIRGETIKDDKNVIKNKLIEAAQDSQIIIFTGGTSVGTKDYLPEIINETGTILIHGIAQRPGAPVLIGFLKESLIFCLPGTPVAAYVSFLKIAGLAVRKMLGCSVLDPRTELIATISKDVPVSGLGYLHYLRVTLEKSQEGFSAIPVKLRGSGVVSSLTFSDGIVEIPPYQEGLKKGDKVKVKLYPK
jgi:molybdenum cofactor synthesis domain-containing protein